MQKMGRGLVGFYIKIFCKIVFRMIMVVDNLIKFALVMRLSFKVSLKSNDLFSRKEVILFFLKKLILNTKFKTYADFELLILGN